MTQTRQILLAARPEGEPEPRHFDLQTTTLPALQQGQVLLRVLWLSLDPYMRGRMRAGKSYAAPFEVGAPLQAGAVAEVLESRADSLATGDIVLGHLPWAENAVADAGLVIKLDPTAAPLQAWLGVLGMPGFTAWTGLNRILEGKSGETIVISAATGAVGSLAGQLAARKGMRVIGVAGGPEKCATALRDYGYAHCLDHRAAATAEALSAQIEAVAPEGVDCYFENVGGKTLEAVLPQMNTFGRVALCGAIAWYSGAENPPALPPVWMMILSKRLRVQGFIVGDHQAHRPEFVAEVAPLVAAGQIRFRETVAEGLDAAPEAFMGLLKGRNDGKQLVRIASAQPTPPVGAK